MILASDLDFICAEETFYQIYGLLYMTVFKKKKKIYFYPL